ncbi:MULTISPECIES: glycerophosphodiester phosphodiesterase family protein [Roseobacteraceae]|uniref:Glycerophosphodiester phosphodiesterase n=4 Tax=Celeribacter baekdonensis TaxID=875171 RepID=K2J7T2_9RHOB|nr:glycerophosphodiester phosphodiesterase family protein [Roseobacter sp. TSBP12]EKE71213.1 glycerophosphodiester phosphodiesterase [Celeribacter baekdonensis B30]KAB6717032.1 glycerophosphodiester phosphodiesterase [Roseobacter sp. TSBP12]|tara:strand:- start:20341 stop:21078 length:738 start_codon:yes stop_codon:yes gene_type:complete
MMTQIACHRGARLSAPENTFPAFEAALAQGGDVLEFDVRQTRDGVLYVMHDETVDRTTNGTGPIADMTSKEVDALDAGAWFDARFATTPVPRLDAFLDAFKSRAAFYIEVKWADCDAIAQIIHRLDIAAQCYTCSFSEQMHLDMLRAAPDVAQMVHWRRATPETLIDKFDATIVEFYACDDAKNDFTLENVRAAQAAGLATQVYSDAVSPALFAQIRDWGVGCLNTDHVSAFHAFRTSQDSPKAP